MNHHTSGASKVTLTNIYLSAAQEYATLTRKKVLEKRYFSVEHSQLAIPIASGKSELPTKP